MKKITPPQVILKPGDNIEKALKKFKRVVKNSNILEEYKNHSRFEKPSDKKRKKKGLSILRNKYCK
jgi:small subunit ribosomal protein S21